VVHGDEPPRQGEDEVGLRDHREGEHKVRDGQHDSPRQTLFGKLLIDTRRDHEMRHLAVPLDGWGIREGVSRSHGDNEILF